MKKFAVSLAWFILSIPLSFAYDLTGKILDGQTSDPLDFVNVALYKMDDPAPINGVVTDETGTFVIPSVSNGKYTIQVSFIGYNTYSRNFTVSGKDVNFGEIRLEVENNMLNEIEVVGQGSQMRFEIDRKVFSVDQNIASAGGSATEVLENIPSVEVDQEGNISLRSSESVEVWINGKPSGLTSDNRAQILQQMPAESIESIEVITNPSAKFNPEGTAGIINLVLKKDRKAGYYGSVNAGLMYPDGARLGGNVGANINYSSSKVDAYANIGYRNMGRQGGSKSDLQNFDGNLCDDKYTKRYDDPDLTQLLQNNTNNDNHNGLFFRAGADYYINDKNSIGFSGFGMVGGGGSESSIDYLQRYMNLDAHPEDTIRNYGRDNTNNSRHSGFNVNLDYKHEWRKGHDLLVSASFSRFGRNNDKTYLQEDIYPAPSAMTTLQTDGGLDKNVELKADYTNKFTETSRLEAGWQTDLSWRDSWADGYDGTTEAPLEPYFNTFNYKEQIHALYVTYGNRFWDKFSAQIGLRGEYMVRSMASYGYEDAPVNLGDYKRSYFQLFPSVYLGYTLTERDEFQLNYTRRVNRPRGWQINSFKDYSDSTNISFGNPALNPEFASAFELNYLHNWDNHSLSASLYYRFTDDVIQRVSYRNIDAGNMESTFMNISQSNNAGLELIAKNRLFKILNLTTSVNLYYRQMGAGTYTNPQSGITETISESSGFSWDARIMGNFMFSPTFTGQISARYRSPRVVAQGTSNGNYSIDLGLRKSFFKRTLNISANVRDLLNSRRRKSETWGNGFWEYSESYWSGRTIGLTVTYNFGNMSGDKRRNDRMPEGGTPGGMGDEGGMDW